MFTFSSPCAGADKSLRYRCRIRADRLGDDGVPRAISGENV